MERVVVTGLGALTPLGHDVASLADGLFAGRSAISRWRRPWPEGLLCKIGGDLATFSLAGHLTGRGYGPALEARLKKLLRTTPLSGQATALVALEAWREAGLDVAGLSEEALGRIGHISAAHNVTVPYIAENVRLFDDEPEYIEPLFGMHCLDTDVAAVTSELLGLRGPTFTVGGACASGNLAAIQALDLIRAGRADAVMLTGAPIALEPVALQGWAIIDAVSYRSFNDTPERASRPFDRRREGFVPSEGAASLMLESLSFARRRGAVILGEILGGGAASDANRTTQPHREGQERAMRLALADARIDASRIDYVNAHATSTPLGDAVELSAIAAVLGERARSVPINATKSMMGHCLTSAGVIELVATILQMRRGLLHPTINQEEPDPELLVDCVPNVAREASITCALSNSFGFGGINSSVLVGPPP